MPNALETEQTSFFGFTHEVRISSSTMELVEELEGALFQHSEGDRQVRRYFDAYDTPFVGEERRKSNYNYD
ncbi:unnamed protein product [Pieris brassicae]|uniref:Uncharacterized protein n=1 Tax=Pieris brassicae TaxID=7116 RepID=A0A9P0X5L7_PIEBR|nr:unnamed protein product [Pieris brassicae]